MSLGYGSNWSHGLCLNLKDFDLPIQPIDFRLVCRGITRVLRERRFSKVKQETNGSKDNHAKAEYSKLNPRKSEGVNPPDNCED